MKALIDKPSIFFWIKRDFLSHHLLTKKRWFIVHNKLVVHCKCVWSDRFDIKLFISETFLVVVFGNLKFCELVLFVICLFWCFETESCDFQKRPFLTSKKCSNSDPKSRRWWTFSRTCPQLPTVKTRFTNQWHHSSTHKRKNEPTINEVTSFEAKLLAYLTHYY